MTEEKTESYKDKSIWKRGLYMLIFIFLQGVAKFVTLVVIVAQFITVLFTAKTNPKLLSFGQSLSQYQYQILLFLTYNSEVHPYPFGDWPEEDKTETPDEIATK